MREVTAFITKRVYLNLYELNLEAGGSWSREGEPERGKGSAERVHLCHRCPRKKKKKEKKEVSARQCGVRVHLCHRCPRGKKKKGKKKKKTGKGSAVRRARASLPDTEGGKKEKKERERLGGARPSLP